MQSLILLISGLAAGFVDSVVGGGGLVSLPVLSIFFGPGAHAIGTNKIVGSIAALSAFLVYWRRGHIQWRDTLIYSFWVAAGSASGSRVAPLMPVDLFKWLLLIVAPIILALIWKKDLWTRHVNKASFHRAGWAHQFFNPKIVLAGFVAGFYDGFFGPGGGTAMFLGLYFVAGFSLLGAMAGSKLVNSFSALTALGVYSYGGYVHWANGIVMAVGVCIGAVLGARLATKRAAEVVRPLLAVVVFLLIAKLLLN